MENMHIAFSPPDITEEEIAEVVDLSLIHISSYILKVFGGDSNNNSSATHENLKNIRDLGKKVSVYWGYRCV